jgi:hypothetical protein
MDILLVIACLFVCVALGVQIGIRWACCHYWRALDRYSHEAVMLKISDGVSKVAMRHRPSSCRGCHHGGGRYGAAGLHSPTCSSAPFACAVDCPWLLCRHHFFSGIPTSSVADTSAIGSA